MAPNLNTDWLPNPQILTQLSEWLPGANQRVLRRTGAAPAVVFEQDYAAIGPLPPVPPRIGLSDRIRIARDYCVRVAGNDYSVDPSVIGRQVDVRCGLDQVTVTCAGLLVAEHARCWDRGQTITDPAHVATAAELRRRFQQRHRPEGDPGSIVATRALTDYDTIFGITSTGVA